jgi:hypothetical protein
MAIAYYASAELLLADGSQESLVKVKAFRDEYEKFVEDAVNRFRALSESQPKRMLGGRYF